MSAGAGINVELFQARRSFQPGFRPGMGPGSRPLMAGEMFFNVADGVLCFGINSDTGAYVTYKLTQV